MEALVGLLDWLGFHGPLAWLNGNGTEPKKDTEEEKRMYQPRRKFALAALIVSALSILCMFASGCGKVDKNFPEDTARLTKELQAATTHDFVDTENRFFIIVYNYDGYVGVRMAYDTQVQGYPLQHLAQIARHVVRYQDNKEMYAMAAHQFLEGKEKFDPAKDSDPKQ